MDADYCFIYVNVGTNGRAGDAGIFNLSALYAALENDLLDLPPDHVILGDDAFPLKTYLMKRYPINTAVIKEKVFNYRLSRARNKVENAFGILASRFRLFLRPIEVKHETVEKAVWAACTLHNWLRKTSGSYLQYSSVDRENLDDASEIIPGLWRDITSGLLPLRPARSNNYRREAEAIRNAYADYFCHDGILPWQWRKIGLPADYEYISDEENVDDDLEPVNDEENINELELVNSDGDAYI